MTTAMDRVKYRFSTQRFQKVIDSLSEDQKGFLAKNGFEKFLGFRKFTVPMPFLEWVMGQVVTDLSQFKHRLKSFKFTRYMVQQIIGIPSGEIPIILHSGGVKISDKLSIRDAVRNLLDQHDEQSFIKWFMLVALSTIICPSTQNFVNINYLPYLLDVSQINTFDWSTHVLNYILSEVKKYQGFISSKDDGKIYVGSCLPLLAIAYMDFIDFSHEYANHHNFCYDVPRICNVRSEDFLFAANVDRNLSNPGRPSYGILEFRSLISSPYFEEPLTDGPIEHDYSISSDFFPGSHHESVAPFQIIPSIEGLIDKHCNLLKNDVSAGIVDKGETVYSDFVNQFGSVFSNRLSLLSSEILAHIESVKYATNSEETDKLTNNSGSLHIHCHSENVVVSESTPTENDTHHDLSNIQQETDNLVDHTDEERLVSSSFNHDRQKSCSNTQAALNDDINCPSTPTFTDQMEGVGGFEQDIEPSVMNDTAPCGINPKRKCRMGSSTIDKKKRKKRAAIPSAHVNSPVKIKLTNEMELSYIKYVRSQNIDPIENDPSPTFVSIAGFECSYDSFRLSLQPRGFVSNDLMAVFVQYFNDDHKLNTENIYDRNKVAFTPFLVEKLMLDPKTYIPESNEPELTRINEQMDIANADLLLFPLILNEHWILICINYLVKKVHFFDPAIRASNSESILPANSIKFATNNVVINFQRTCKVAEIFDRDLQNYELQVPRCPKHSNSPFQKFDSGIFAMLLMYNWNGSVIKIFDHTEATKFRKLIAYKLMNSDLNEAAIKNNQTEDQP